MTGAPMGLPGISIPLPVSFVAPPMANAQGLREDADEEYVAIPPSFK